MKHEIILTVSINAPYPMHQEVWRKTLAQAIRNTNRELDKLGIPMVEWEVKSRLGETLPKSID